MEAQLLVPNSSQKSVLAQLSRKLLPPQIIPHLFRTEFRKITAVLCKLFGLEHIEVAEDLASETFLAAVETWPYKGIPENPTAWLYTVAKNKTKNYLLRNKLFEQSIAPQITYASDSTNEIVIDLSDQHISDSQLQMLFAISHPAIPAESQIGLALRILCGFGIDEIANAFLASKEAINKRLFRAKEKLREEKMAIQFPGTNEIDSRLDSVLITLYLLFNEGYYSESQDAILRDELCLEAMRLTELLLQYEQTNQPKVNALYSLMCFQASRFEARKNENAEIILYNDQDDSLWDRELISKGATYLRKASTGSQLSKYHLEASIAYWHTNKDNSNEKWENILQLFNHLLALEYSPIAALNRTFALSKVKGKQTAILEAERLNLEGNRFHFMLLGDLYETIDNKKAIEYFEQSLNLTHSDAERKLIQNRIEKIYNRLVI